MKYLYILRGPFGTGKTEFIRTLLANDNIVSCWDYYRQYGQNRWNEKLKPYADEYCRNGVKNLMEQGADKIAVTNSFSKCEDMEYFYQLAEQHQYTVFSMVMTNQCCDEYKKNVPDHVIQDQTERLTADMKFYSIIS